MRCVWLQHQLCVCVGGGEHGQGRPKGSLAASLVQTQDRSHMVVQALVRDRDLCVLKANLIYTVRPYLKRK